MTYENILAKTSIFEEKRKKGDLSPRLEIDEIGAEFYRKRQENIEILELREKLLPNIPGFEAESLLNRYYQDKFLDALVLLRVRAQKAEMQAATNMRYQMAWSVIDLIKLNPEAFKGIYDAASDAREVKIKLMQEFYKKSAEFIILSNSIMLNERMRWISYVTGETYRAYMSQNRLEWFSCGTALAGLSQQVDMAAAEMELAYRESSAKFKGLQMRRSGFAYLDVLMPSVFEDNKKL